MMAKETVKRSELKWKWVLFPSETLTQFLHADSLTDHKIPVSMLQVKFTETTKYKYCGHSEVLLFGRNDCLYHMQTTLQTFTRCTYWYWKILFFKNHVIALRVYTLEQTWKSEGRVVGVDCTAVGPGDWTQLVRIVTVVHCLSEKTTWTQVLVWTQV